MDHSDNCMTCKDLLNRPTLDDCPTIADIRRSSYQCAQCSIIWQGIYILHGNDQSFPQMLDENLAFERNNGALRASAGFSHNSAGKIDAEFYREAGMWTFPVSPYSLFYAWLTAWEGEPAWAQFKPALPLSAQASDSNASFNLIKNWLHSCDQSHKCYEVHDDLGPLLPTRVVYVGSSHEPNGLRLHESTHDQRGKYIALSHCWGKTQIIRTLKANIEEHKKGIVWPSLSKTFQDAVTITRRLGIQYLWIDSLCIIQDDGADWEMEASRMWSVYRNAYLVVSATSAPDGTRGCFPERKVCVLEAGSNDAASPIRVLARKTTDHGPFMGHLAFGSGYPIFKRAWVMQERFLAARMLHYTEAELVWECMEAFQCECGADISKRGAWFRDSFKPAFALNFRKNDFLSRINIWYRLIEEFTAKDITKEFDRLPALSGIAQGLQCAELGTYMAGMWSMSMPESLCWTPVLVIGKRPQDLHRRVHPYRAPSWSWAALEGDVQFHDGLFDETSKERAVRVVDGWCTPSGLDPYGQVKGGHLVLSAPLIKATIGSHSLDLGEFLDARWGSPSEYYHLTKGNATTHFLPDVLNGVSVGQEVFCLPLLYANRSGDRMNWMGLVLEGPSENKTSYTRIGFVDGGNMEMLEGASEAMVRVE